ncbi:hypothetical protein EK21DRAFT_98838 [Setomelanomma holmii]|uniref:Heterokaryon incompatibility domain-containing protein n=1 Tax=Setomelanomma holmii TaxID=210430 RepID=A0A9P4LP45_9PLEO|nr:hypothetical protein EK21DRAFT_98838 [Setomelanomma holmii]
MATSIASALTGSELCDVCSAIDFPAYFYPPAADEVATRDGVNNALYKERELGTGAEIRLKSVRCAFCDLVHKAPVTISDEAVISMSSTLCGRNSDAADGDSTPATYYIRVVSNLRGVVANGYIQLLAEDAHLLGHPQEFLARVPRTDGFNMSQAVTWLEICRRKHGRACDSLEGDPSQGSPLLQPVHLLAINLADMSICQMPPGSEYVALSYCWPAKAYLTLVQENREELSGYNALVYNMEKLPGTVQDAIYCAKELPFRYLWIDALCIIQDDNDHKNKQLRQMDRVYNCAALTLPLRSLSRMWDSFDAALSLYTRRDVSYPSDMLKAFEGVKAVLSDAMQTDFWQGMPEKILAQALCWQLRGGFYRRRNRLAGQPPSKPLFPSWSWAGWESQINLTDYLNIKFFRTDAEWYIVNARSIATRLDIYPQWVSMRSHQPSASILKPFLPNIVPRESVDPTTEEWRDARTLASWTTRAFMVLDGSYHQLNSRHEQLWPQSTNFAIKDSRGVTAGCILLPKDFFDAFGVQWLRCEFILISRSLATQSKMSYFDESVYEVKDWCHLNVMMISRPSHLDAYEAIRVGVGVVHEDAWVAAKPETDFVKLI